MRTLSADFRERRRVSPRLLAAALVTSVAASGWELWQLWVIDRELSAVRAEVASLNAQLDEARAKKEREHQKMQVTQAPEAQLAAKIKSFPLDQVLTTVEKSKIDGVRLTMLEIDAAEGVVSIECEYDSSELVFGYVEKLNSDTGRRWQLTSLKSRTDRPGGGFAAILSR